MWTIQSNGFLIGILDDAGDDDDDPENVSLSSFYFSVVDLSDLLLILTQSDLSSIIRMVNIPQRSTTIDANWAQ